MVRVVFSRRRFLRRGVATTAVAISGGVVTARAHSSLRHEPFRFLGTIESAGRDAGRVPLDGAEVVELVLAPGAKVAYAIGGESGDLSALGAGDRVSLSGNLDNGVLTATSVELLLGDRGQVVRTTAGSIQVSDETRVGLPPIEVVSHGSLASPQACVMGIRAGVCSDFGRGALKVELKEGKSMRVRVALMAMFAAAILAVAGVASASSSRSSSSYWKWGYNYVGVSVNPNVSSPSGLYGVEGLYKNSGGTVYHGFALCGGRLASGTTTWYGYPYSINPGCPALDLGAFVNWWSGSTSYLKIEASG
jgi:hypothetical protein